MVKNLCYARIRSFDSGHCWEQMGVSPRVVGAGAGIDGGVSLGEAEAACGAVCAKLAEERGLCVGVTDDLVGSDGLGVVMTYSGLDLDLDLVTPGEENVEDDQKASSG